MTSHGTANRVVPCQPSPEPELKSGKASNDPLLLPATSEDLGNNPRAVPGLFHVPAMAVTADRGGAR
ncbi:MAG TPA: hypothetical protein VFO16_11120 [Pseudonocardiaceae bacterium]|nr:hypothetical protein [Pseudonocardiaceae bacterium]